MKKMILLCFLCVGFSASAEYHPSRPVGWPLAAERFEIVLRDFFRNFQPNKNFRSAEAAVNAMATKLEMGKWSQLLEDCKDYRDFMLERDRVFSEIEVYTVPYRYLKPYLKGDDTSSKGNGRPALSWYEQSVISGFKDGPDYREEEDNQGINLHRLVDYSKKASLNAVMMTANFFTDYPRRARTVNISKRINEFFQIVLKRCSAQEFGENSRIFCSHVNAQTNMAKLTTEARDLEIAREEKIQETIALEGPACQLLEKLTQKIAQEAATSR